MSTLENRVNGVVYIAFGKSMGEVMYSAKSIKRIHPNLSLTLLTDRPIKSDLFDEVRVIQFKSERVKQDYLLESPYENTLYLDSDTGIIGSIIEIFDLMGRFDLAATHDLIRKDGKKSAVYPDYAAIPDGFPEYCGGVILFKKSEAVSRFFELWRKNYAIWHDLTGEVRDQPSFRVSLWQCPDLHLHTLPPEYNIRSKKYDNIIPRINHWHKMEEGK